LFAGAATTLSMPPWSAWPVLWVTLPLLIILLESTKSKGSAFLVGWAFGVGFFASGFAWISNAFFVDSETFAALAVPGVGGLVGGFALYTGIFGVIIRVFPPLSADAMPQRRVVHHCCRIAFFAVLWCLIEWWRGWFLTGFPWNPIGSVWVTIPPLLQGAAVFGVYGLSLVTLLAATSVSLLTQGHPNRAALLLVAACHAPLFCFALAGAVRLSGETNAVVDGVLLRVVQPNIAQADKWRPALRQQHLLDQVVMSTDDANAVTHVLWAETAAPFALNRAPQAMSALSVAAPVGGVVLTGAPRVLGSGRDRQSFNSLFAISRNGRIVASYDKAHLVPFGEYTPLQGLIPIPQLTVGTGFSAGPGPITITVSGLPSFSPLICYEIIFPGAVTGPGQRPDWLFNLTNDAWFGLSSGPYQHLAAAQMRAVEEGLPVIRAANTGISATVDSFGRLIFKLPLGQRGILDTPLPTALPPTLFARFGNSLFLFVALGLAGIAWAVAGKASD